MAGSRARWFDSSCRATAESSTTRTLIRFMRGRSGRSSTIAPEEGHVAEVTAPAVMRLLLRDEHRLCPCRHDAPHHDLAGLREEPDLPRQLPAHAARRDAEPFTREVAPDERQVRVRHAAGGARHRE